MQINEKIKKKALVRNLWIIDGAALFKLTMLMPVMIQNMFWFSTFSCSLWVGGWGVIQYSLPSADVLCVSAHCTYAHHQVSCAESETCIILYHDKGTRTGGVTTGRWSTKTDATSFLTQPIYNWVRVRMTSPHTCPPPLGCPHPTNNIKVFTGVEVIRQRAGIRSFFFFSSHKNRLTEDLSGAKVDKSPWWLDILKF